MFNLIKRYVRLPELHLRRITSSGAYIPEIDGLRFVAILSVVLYHVPIQIALRSNELAQTNPFWRVISHGNRGVQLFFLISGFILCMPFAKQHLFPAGNKVRLYDYYLRRVTRLEPPYLLANLLRIPLLLFAFHRPLKIVILHGLAGIFYLHSAIYGAMSYINPPNWSLEVEIQFYCLAPLLAKAYFAIRSRWMRRITTLALILLTGAVQIALISPEATPRLNLSIVNYIQYFLAGFLLCDLYLTDWERLPRHFLWDLLSASLWIWIFTAVGPSVHLLLPLAAFLAYIGAFKGELFDRFFRLRWVCLIGGMCYSIYLTHNLAITGVDLLLNHFFHFHGSANWYQVVFVYAFTFPVVLLIGLSLFVSVERPCMDRNWPRQLRRKLAFRRTPEDSWSLREELK